MRAASYFVCFLRHTECREGVSIRIQNTAPPAKYRLATRLSLLKGLFDEAAEEVANIQDYRVQLAYHLLEPKSVSLC